MLEKIETEEIMTMRAAMLKYRTKYFYMVITEIVDGGQNDLGYVIYIADSERELSKVPRAELKGLRVGRCLGVAAEPYPTFGNIVYHDQV